MADDHQDHDHESLFVTKMVWDPKTKSNVKRKVPHGIDCDVYQMKVMLDVLKNQDEAQKRREAKKNDPLAVQIARRTDLTQGEIEF